ncbi:MAG: DUF1565 domain-containing protein [Chloroflexota bacterium]
MAATPQRAPMPTIQHRRRRSRVIWLCLSAVFALGMAVSHPAASQVAAATVYYVATTGSDAASGSASHPWRTIRYAMTRLAAGDTVYVRAGTYEERISSPRIRAGTSTAPITVRAYPREWPVIKGYLWVTGATFWTFRGISVAWATTNSTSEPLVKFTNGVGWSYTDGDISGAHSYAGLLIIGNVASQPRGWRVAGSCIHDTYPTHGLNQDHNVYITTGLASGSGVFERNIVFNATNGRNLKLGPSGSTGGSVGVLVRYNTFYNANQPLSPSYDSNHNRFDHNILGASRLGYSLIYAYELRGIENVASNNLGYLAPALLGASSGGGRIVDGGGNRFPVDPRFNSTASCQGFHPLNTAAAGYGRFGG